MHALIIQSSGWNLEMLADESDIHQDSPVQKELQGCSFIKETREDQQYVSEIRYEEQRHNELIFVEAIVFGQHQRAENTQEDIHYFRRHKFEGTFCKGEAARYAYALKTEIDLKYFSQKE